jgi:sulfite exporter TauE/SafE
MFMAAMENELQKLKKSISHWLWNVEFDFRFHCFGMCSLTSSVFVLFDLISKQETETRHQDLGLVVEL